MTHRLQNPVLSGFHFHPLFVRVGEDFNLATRDVVGQRAFTHFDYFKMTNSGVG